MLLALDSHSGFNPNVGAKVSEVVDEWMWTFYVCVNSLESTTLLKIISTKLCKKPPLSYDALAIYKFRAVAFPSCFTKEYIPVLYAVLELRDSNCYIFLVVFLSYHI